MIVTPNVYMAESFLEALDRVPLDTRRKVRATLHKFHSDPTAASLNYEPINDVRDRRIRTVRVDLTYRAVVLHPGTGADYVFVWVDHHDKAMDWARDKVFPIHPLTGAIQMLDMAWVEENNADAAGKLAQKALDDYALFETFPDDDLMRAGVPEVLLPTVRALQAPADLERLRPHIPVDLYEVLFWVANEHCSVDQALEHAGVTRAAETVDVDDVAAALAHPDSHRRFHMVESEAELDEILDAPMEKWRIFLHPSQERLVVRNFNGPARVLGGAGTGKTVVAMHRVRHLARNVFAAPGDRILFTTFTRNLAANIRQNLENLCGAEFARIEVTNLHAWAVQALRDHGVAVAIVEPDEARRCWRNVMAAQATNLWDERFVRHEWEQVVQAQGIEDSAVYLRTPRHGQSVPLNRAQRAALWSIFAAYRAELTRLGKVEWPDVIRLVRQRLESGQMAQRYRAVVVDETQDLTADELRLVRALVPPGANDLFFVGDAHQRIYGQPLVMAHCGIAIRGRAARLRINYRTTEQIRRWATRVLDGFAIDDMDGAADDLHDYRSLMSGPQPTLRTFARQTEECDFIVGELRVLLEATEPERICVVARTHHQLREVYLPALRAAAIPYLLLEADTPDYAGSGVRLATMHRVKGLEFEHVLIAGLTADAMPPQYAVGEEDLLRERCLLHVAASRARETLTISCGGRPSPLLATMT